MPIKKNIPFKLLISIYGIIPLVWITLLIDIFLLNGKLKFILPVNPEGLRVVLIFFLWPHIIMSFVTILDEEYLRKYKPSFFNYKALALLAVFSICFINREVFFYIYAFLTLKHFTCQQVGLEKITSGDTGRSPYILYFLSLLLLNIWVEFPEFSPLKELKFFIFNNNLQFHFFILISLILFSDSYKRANKKKSAPILWGNFLLLITIFLCFILGYPFFSFLIPRVAHDLTAITFYAFHDYNRNRDSKKNVLFSIMPYSKRYFSLYLILFSFIFANFLYELAIRVEIIAIFSFGLGLLHYFLEDFIWKKDMPHRREIFLDTDLQKGRL